MTNAGTIQPTVVLGGRVKFLTQQCQTQPSPASATRPANDDIGSGRFPGSLSTEAHKAEPESGRKGKLCVCVIKNSNHVYILGVVCSSRNWETGEKVWHGERHSLWWHSWNLCNGQDVAHVGFGFGWLGSFVGGVWTEAGGWEEVFWSQLCHGIVSQTSNGLIDRLQATVFGPTVDRKLLTGGREWKQQVNILYHWQYRSGISFTNMKFEFHSTLMLCSCEACKKLAIEVCNILFKFYLCRKDRSPSIYVSSFMSKATYTSQRIGLMR